jgi:hypothetical protein
MGARHVAALTLSGKAGNNHAGAAAVILTDYYRFFNEDGSSCWLRFSPQILLLLEQMLLSIMNSHPLCLIAIIYLCE